MKYSALFAKSFKSHLKEEGSVNAKFLQQAGFVDKLMAGSYTLLPLGRKVERNIEQIVREEMNKTGAQEVLMPLLHPKDIWNETGRWDSAKDVMYQFEKDDKEYALSFTHEEVVLDLVRKHIFSYKDLPIKIYHFSTKFRNEPRAKSGMLRGREFLMKDLYSVHADEKDLDAYYWEIADTYTKIFKRLNLAIRIVEAAGGVFTERHTHEFQVLCPTGEDTIYYCDVCDFAENKEIAKVKEGDRCPKCLSKKSKQSGLIKLGKSIEVGNIFRFGTVYSEKMDVKYKNDKGDEKHVWFGSYGIGITRLIGTLAEIFHDDKGIIWPDAVAPYQTYLIGIMNNESGIKQKTNEVYNKLQQAGIEVLYDDRENVTPGEKFANSDLIGIPFRAVVSPKTNDMIEIKRRGESKTELLGVEAVIKLVKVVEEGI